MLLIAPNHGGMWGKFQWSPVGLVLQVFACPLPSPPCGNRGNCYSYAICLGDCSCTHRLAAAADIDNWCVCGHYVRVTFAQRAVVTQRRVAPTAKYPQTLLFTSAATRIPGDRDSVSLPVSVCLSLCLLLAELQATCVRLLSTHNVRRGSQVCH